MVGVGGEMGMGLLVEEMKPDSGGEKLLGRLEASASEEKEQNW
jgi:hypothetical protein